MQLRSKLFGYLTEGRNNMADKIVRHLRNLIRNASINYRNGFSWDDVKLTDEFKTAFSDYLSENKRGHSIEYYDYTSVLTTSNELLIFIPNQWFAISVYAKEVCRELLKNKSYFEKVVQELCVDPYKYANDLRSTIDKNLIQNFSITLRNILKSEYPRATAEVIDEATKYITEFVTNYDWWSGRKTVDRGDFFVSVVLNMLGLVNASQGYVADITYAYCTDDKLDSITEEIASFTIDLGGSTWVTYDDSHDEAYDSFDLAQDTLIDTLYEKPSSNVIHISSANKKEIKIKI